MFYFSFIKHNFRMNYFYVIVLESKNQRVRGLAKLKKNPDIKKKNWIEFTKNLPSPYQFFFANKHQRF